jgi:hypothetical protein
MPQRVRDGDGAWSSGLPRGDGNLEQCRLHLGDFGLARADDRRSPPRNFDTIVRHTNVF